MLVHIFKEPLPRYKNILIFAPHPDDEILGCGGLIAKQLLNKNKVSVIILTGGEASHAGCCNISANKLKEERRKLTLKAADIIKLPKESLFFMDFIDSKINKNDKEIFHLQKIIKRVNPDAIFVTNPFEGWDDHVISGKIIKELINNENIAIFEYCVWLWFNMPLRKIFKINWRKAKIINLSEQEIDLKNKAIDSYIYPKAACGKPYSGFLPKVFIQSNRWKNELYFKVK